jgi:hypothetical protein
MPVAGRIVGSEPFQPRLEILQQSILIVVDKNRRCDVHGVDQRDPFTDATLYQTLRDSRSNIDKSTPFGKVEPKLCAKRFHLVSKDFVHPLDSHAWNPIIAKNAPLFLSVENWDSM